MTLEQRRPTEAELPAFVRSIGIGFGFHADDDNVADMGAVLEAERHLAVFDGDEIVGTAGAFTFEMTVPGGVQVPTAGVTIVTVRTTHRRRGILRSMMRAQLDDVAARGEPLAALTASESSIYGRFGYGAATLTTEWSLDLEHATLAQPSLAPGRVRIVDADVVAAHGPAIYDEVRRRTPGAVDRNDVWWADWLKDRPWTQNGMGTRWYAVHEAADGTVDGVIGYRRARGGEHGISAHRIHVDELHGVDDEVEAALWTFAADHDLTTTMTAANRPVDEPLRWRLADPRQLRTTQMTDALWIRIVDVCAALSARRYATSDRLVLEVTDRFRPDTEGAYLLDGGPTGAACTRLDAAPDLTVDIADLGAIYLGGVTPSVLHRAGRIREHTDGATARADTFFGSSPAPWMATGF